MRYPGTCTTCGLRLPAGTRAFWDGDARSTTCLACRASADGEAGDAASLESTAEAPTAPPRPIATGQAGGSARREYENRHQRREQQLDRRWGALAGIAKVLSDDPQSTKSWAKGSVGERRLAARLRRELGGRAVVLDDCKVPNTRGNIDHIAVAASGVWVIDAKNYTGLVERRDIGCWLKTDIRVYVGGRDRSKLAENLGWQLDAVRTAVGRADVAIEAVLCFVGGEWKLLAKPFQLGGVWVTWSKKLADMIAEPGPLTPVDVTDIARRIATALPPQGIGTSTGASDRGRRG